MKYLIDPSNIYTK